MERRLNLSHYTEEERDKILHVLGKDSEVRQIEKERIGVIRATLTEERESNSALAQQTQFNTNCCIRCCLVFGLLFSRRRSYCCWGYNVCSNCCHYLAHCKKYLCHFCAKQRDFAKQTCSWFYDAVKIGTAARVVRSLYRATHYYKHLQSNNSSGQKQVVHSLRVCHRFRFKHESAWSCHRSLREDTGDESDKEASDDDSNPEEQTTNQGGHGIPGPPPPSPGAGGRRLLTVDPSLLPSSSPSSASSKLRPRTPEPSRRGVRAVKDLDKPRSSHGSAGSSLLKPLPKWDEDRPSKGQVKKVTKDLYKHAFESARKAEERKFKAKFDDLVNDLHRALKKHSSHGLVDSFASTSYGDALSSFRGQIKDLLIVFSRRLQLAYESFDSQETAEDHSQQVKQSVSGFLEDLLGESLDLTSDEAVSDLSSLSDDSANERHAFEDQLAQAVISKIIENHRRDVHHDLRNDRHHLSDSSLIPEALDDDDDDNADDDSSHRSNRVPKDLDISKDFEDLKHFVAETQSRSRRYEDDLSRGVDSCDGEEEVTDFRGPESARASSSFDVDSRDRDFPPLPDFSDLEQIDFESGEVDPDLLQMNLAVIPEETEEELEQEEAEDSQWRENWIFKGHGPAPSHHSDRKRLRAEDGEPQYMMVPRPDDHLAPRVGNRDVDQLSDLSDNEDDDDRSFYPRTSEELARISKYKRSSSPPSLRPTSLIPTSMDDLDNSLETSPRQDSVYPKKRSSSTDVYDVDLDYEDVSVGTDDFVGPIVEPSQKELKLLDSLVAADEDDPKFVVAPESVTIQEGEPVKFSCQVSGTQPADVFWYREQAEVEELEEGEDIEFQEEGGRHSATLYHVGRQHAGQYMCIALNERGKAIKYLIVTIKDNKQELKKPEFLKELKDVEVFEGQSVKFRCKVKGYPPPRIHWYKDGSLLKSNKSCRIEKFGNRDYLLTLDQVTMENDAEYMVVARNVAGQVKSTAQLIVEPREEGQPRPPLSASASLTTLHTDSDSDKSTSGVVTKPQRRGTASVPVGAVPVESKAGSTREDHVRNSYGSGFRSGTDLPAGGMLASAEELDIVNQHLDDMERHLGVEEEESAPTPDLSQDQSADSLLSSDETDLDKPTRSSRKLTSNTLSVLQAAEEIIQQEKSLPEPSSPGLPSRTTSRDSASANTSADVSHKPSSTIHHHDLAASVSSGYGSTSMTSSGLDFPDSVLAGSSSSRNLPSPEDEFAMYLPPLGEDSSGSYREEVSISLSAGSGTKTPKNEKPSGSVSSAATPHRTVPQSSRRVRENSSLSTSSTKNDSDRASVVIPSAQTHSLSHRESPSSVKDKAESWQTASEESKDLVLNFGPKEINAAAFSRDYDVKGGRGEEKAERKRWTVNLDPYLPSADVVNRRQHVDEGEEKLPSHGDPSDSTPQISPRSSRGSSSNCSTISTSRESLDSGVSCTPFTADPRPPPVHMVGETREEEVPESRAEYDADSGVELPSVSRLKAMFAQSDHSHGGSSREEPRSDGGNFKRIHSITARSLTKEQLHKLRDGGSSQHKEGRVQSRSTIQLNTSSSSQPLTGNFPGKTSSTVRTTLSSKQQPSEQAQKDTHAPVPQRRIRIISPSQFVQHQQQDSSGQNVQVQGQSSVAVSNSLSRSRTNSPRPKSAILEGTVLSSASPMTPRPRSHSDSDSADSAAVAYKPKIRSGCISARAAFWERRILQGEDADENVDSNFPDMVEGDQH